MFLALTACSGAEPQDTAPATKPADTPAVSAPPGSSRLRLLLHPISPAVATPASAPTTLPSQPATVTSQVPGWPPYPGEARPGDRGEHVREWQQILIQAGAISEIPENHDGSYGPGMFQVVLRLQQSWGWSDADGIAGPRTYQMITSGAPVPPPHAGDRDCVDFANQAEAQTYFEPGVAIQPTMWTDSTETATASPAKSPDETALCYPDVSISRAL
jgi:peptidoglycan hydrolase-like protein with peptidoglycan-binding domain